MQWFCEKHRLSQNYADARLPAPDPLAQHAEAIRAAGTPIISDVIEIGRHLVEAKKICGQGNWLAWLEEEFRWTNRTALNFMHVYEMASHSKRISNDLDLPLSSLYLLASPSTPEAVRHDVIERATSGEEFSHAEVKDIVTKAKPKPKLPSTIPEVEGPGMLEPAWDDIIDQIADLFKQLPLDDQVRCAKMLRNILQGQA
jgi:hypothetical protein